MKSRSLSPAFTTYMKNIDQLDAFAEEMESESAGNLDPTDREKIQYFLEAADSEAHRLLDGIRKRLSVEFGEKEAIIKEKKKPPGWYFIVGVHSKGRRHRKPLFKCGVYLAASGLPSSTYLLCLWVEGTKALRRKRLEQIQRHFKRRRLKSFSDGTSFDGYCFVRLWAKLSANPTSNEVVETYAKWIKSFVIAPWKELVSAAQMR